MAFGVGVGSKRLFWGQLDRLITVFSSLFFYIFSIFCLLRGHFERFGGGVGFGRFFGFYSYRQITFIL